MGNVRSTGELDHGQQKENCMKLDDERVLVQRARHDSQAFGLLYDRYVARIYAYALRESGDVATAEDVVSATFEKAMNHLHTYEWRGTSFGAWLYKIARNELHMIWRKQKWLAPLLDVFRSGQNVERTIQHSQATDEVQAALGRLHQRDQEILRLRYYESLAHEEIGEILGCSASTTRVRLHRALKRLRSKLTHMELEVIFDVE